MLCVYSLPREQAPYEGSLTFSRTIKRAPGPFGHRGFSWLRE